MAYYGSGYGAAAGGGNAFGGFPGGYNQNPAGMISPNAGFGGAGFGGAGFVPTMGTNLPSVNPNNFPGTVHFGPSSTFVGEGYGQFPAGAGYMNPSFGAGATMNPYTGF